MNRNFLVIWKWKIMSGMLMRKESSLELVFLKYKASKSSSPNWKIFRNIWFFQLKVKEITHPTLIQKKTSKTLKKENYSAFGVSMEKWEKIGLSAYKAALISVEFGYVLSPWISTWITILKKRLKLLRDKIKKHSSDKRKSKTETKSYLN